LGSDVTGYIAAYNAQWQRTAESLRMLWRSTRQLQRVGRAMGKAAAAYCASISGPSGGQKEGMLPGQVYK
jgi:hypothetical protein